VDFIHGNAIALSCQCKCITSCFCCSARHLGWQLATTGNREPLGAGCPPNPANVRENGQMIENLDCVLADGLLCGQRTRVKCKGPMRIIALIDAPSAALMCASTASSLKPLPGFEGALDAPQAI